MIYEALRGDDIAKNHESEENEIIEMIEEREQTRIKQITLSIIFPQVLATSIDALVVGIILNNKPIGFVFLSSAIISGVTFVMCFVAILIGKKIGTKFNSKAEIFGGLLLFILAIKTLIDWL